jgi:cytochrome c oxidase cbb3-type subunit III
MTDKRDNKNSAGPTLPDHDYDGIREEDNPLPRWWVGLFWITIIFAIVYVPIVHIFEILPGAQLQRSVASAARLQEQRDLEAEASGAFDKDPLVAGQKYYKTFCVTCHGQYAEGGIGPNLHDAYWIQSPAEDSIRAVIMNGVAAKGMPTWGPILGDRKIGTLVQYVASLYQVPLPVPGKKPEGQLYSMEPYRKRANETTVKSDSTKKM